MTEFETSAALSIEISSRELRDARKEIEDGLGDVQVGVSTSGGSGGGAGAAMLDDISDHTDELVTLADERNDILEDILDELEQQGGGGLSIPFVNPGGGRRPKTGGPGGRPTVVPFPIPGPDDDPSSGPTSTPSPTLPPINLPNPFSDLPDVPTLPNLPFGFPSGGPSGSPTGTGQPSPSPGPIIPPSDDPKVRLPGPGGRPAPGTPAPIDIPGGARPDPTGTVSVAPGANRPPQVDPRGAGAAGGLAAVVGGLAKSTQGLLGPLGGGGSPSPGSGGLGFPLPLNPNTFGAVGLNDQIRQNAREIQGQTGGGQDRVQVDVSGRVRVEDGRRRKQDIVDAVLGKVEDDIFGQLGGGTFG